LATTLVSPLVYKAEQQELRQLNWRYSLLLVSALTFLAVLLEGYHPYAEDGGLYLAGIKRLLDPGMYPHQTAFVVEHLRFSVFAPFVAGLVRGSGLRVETVLFVMYIASFWMMLFAAWHLATRCYEGRLAQTGAVSFFAVWMTLPVAGTSLTLMDPYVTARSISSPCALLALLGTMDFFADDGSGARRKGLALAAGSLVVAFLFHPLMAAYALGCALVLAATLCRGLRRWMFIAVPAIAAGTAGMVQAFSAPESDAYAKVAVTRSYWFLSQWHWYELIGLVAPLAILAIVAAGRTNASRGSLARALLVVGVAAVVVSLCFVHEDAATHLVARLQPLRVFQIIYAGMILFVGAWAAETVLQQSAVRWIAAFSLLAGVMLFAERNIFPASAHFELPGKLTESGTRNPWMRAFLWIRSNTAKDALLALDANYIEKPSEDAQCFRAVAERSALPDSSKDGGEASITPELAPDWLRGKAAQSDLSKKTDEERIKSLKPLGVDWVVLERGAVTGFACDYANEAVKVCRMPNEQSGMVISSESPALPPPPGPR
jgi:hypothetical protein